MITEKFSNHKFSDSQNDWSKQIRDVASTIDALLECLPCSRERSLAMTKLEECVMWANKAIALHGVNQ